MPAPIAAWAEGTVERSGGWLKMQRQPSYAYRSTSVVAAYFRRRILGVAWNDGRSLEHRGIGPSYPTYRHRGRGPPIEMIELLRGNEMPRSEWHRHGWIMPCALRRPAGFKRIPS